MIDFLTKNRELLTLIINLFLMVFACFSLILVYIEYRRSNKLANVNARQSRYQLFLEMDKIIVENPSFRKFISNPTFIAKYNAKELQEEEVKEISFIEMVLNLCQISYNHSKHGLVDTDLGWVEDFIKNEYVIKYWESGYKTKYPNDFEKYVNKIIKKNTLRQN